MTDPRLDRDDPDYDAEAEAGFGDWLNEQESDWDEHDLQEEYNRSVNEGRADADPRT